MSVSIHWFRKGLRLHDNPALLHASQISVGTMLPLFILDPCYLSPQKIADNQMAHLLETLCNLDVNLKKKGSRLFIVLGTPSKVLPIIIKQLKVDLITFESDTEPDSIKMEKEVIAVAKEAGVEEIASFCSHTLYDPEYLLKVSGGRPPLTMPVFLSLLAKAGPPPPPVATPDKLPYPPSMDHFTKLKSLFLYQSVPTLSDLTQFGYDPHGKTTYFIGGEDEALRRMDKFLSQKRRVATFEKLKTLPTALEPDTTALSPFLKFGSLSIRLFLTRIKEVYEICGRDHTLPPVSLEGQLYWREMAYLLAYSTPNFDKMVGNPICKQIPWATGDEAEKLLKRWEFGQTGFPAIDAPMNQLRSEGWMHHLARHLVSCFLTRGDLWLHWEAGRGVFDRHLLDADWSINNFHWHYMSCSALFHQYFRCYKPATFFKKMDPKGSYVRKYVPSLKHFPDEYIYEPWKASMNVQIKCKCIIGKDYPKPIVDHEMASKENMIKMKTAYDKAKQTHLEGEVCRDEDYSVSENMTSKRVHIDECDPNSKKKRRKTT